MKKLLGYLAILSALNILTPAFAQQTPKSDGACDSTCSRDAGLAAAYTPSEILQTCATRFEEQSVVCDAPYSFALYKKTRSAVYCNGVLKGATAWNEDKTTTCVDSCLTTEQLKIVPCADPLAVGFMYENRQVTNCALTGNTSTPWMVGYQSCVVKYAPSCPTNQLPITQSFNCPAGFTGTYLTTNYYDSTPGICNYTTFSSTQNTTCIPVTACPYMPAKSASFACPAGYTGSYTVTTLYDTTPGVCGYLPPTDNSAVNCVPVAAVAKTYTILDTSTFLGNFLNTTPYTYNCMPGSTTDESLVNNFLSNESFFYSGYPDFYLINFDPVLQSGGVGGGGYSHIVNLDKPNSCL